MKVKWLKKRFFKNRIQIMWRILIRIWWRLLPMCDIWQHSRITLQKNICTVQLSAVWRLKVDVSICRYYRRNLPSFSPVNKLSSQNFSSFYRICLHRKRKKVTAMCITPIDNCWRINQQTAFTCFRKQIFFQTFHRYVEQVLIRSMWTRSTCTLPRL